MLLEHRKNLLYRFQHGGRVKRSNVFNAWNNPYYDVWLHGLGKGRVPISVKLLVVGVIDHGYGLFLARARDRN